MDADSMTWTSHLQKVWLLAQDAALKRPAAPQALQNDVEKAVVLADVVLQAGGHCWADVCCGMLERSSIFQQLLTRPAALFQAGLHAVIRIMCPYGSCHGGMSCLL